MVLACICAAVDVVIGCSQVVPGNMVAIRSKEYAFGGAPARLVAGEHTFTLHNIGKLDHEMVVVRLPAGTGLDQLLAEPPYRVQADVSVIGRTAAKPGKDGQRPVTATFTPGTYVMWCFLSNGGPPHIYRGMRATFVVE